MMRQKMLRAKQKRKLKTKTTAEAGDVDSDDEVVDTTSVNSATGEVVK